MRFWILLLAAFSLTACGAVPPSPYDASSWRMGWGAPHAISANEIYPAKFPKIADAEMRRRESQSNAAPWMLSLGPSGFLLEADLDVDDGNEITTSELEQAQRFLDTHLALVGLAQRASLKKWDDGLYYVSPVDDPRFGISVLHRQTKLTIVGHLWPGFTFRSSARKTPNELLAPWMGMRVVSAEPNQFMPCDPVNSVNDCPQSREPEIVVVGPSVAHYVVSATEVGDAIEVREALVLDLPRNPKPMDVGKTLPPFAIDARTGEPLNVGGFGSGMCDVASCVAWGGARVERNMLFWHWISFERLQRDLVSRPQ